MNDMSLCGQNGCRLLKGHSGQHTPFPTEAWGFMEQRDKNKLTKAGFATPRGGEKGAYQNHVLRSNQVIIPFERLASTSPDIYRDAYVIRLYPEQFFEGYKTPKDLFIKGTLSWIDVGQNAFVLYRTHDSFEQLPPMDHWTLRHLERNEEVVDRRSNDVIDVGHYVLRIPRLGPRPKRYEGPPQGLFAPEYADQETNFLCRCVLAWLIIHTVDSPYTTTQATLLKEILAYEGLLDETQYEYHGVLRRGLTSCPLCLRFIHYPELHSIVEFEDEFGVENAADQVTGATRSTIVNLFHLEPMTYDHIAHIPTNMAWGHAVCNTRLGQRRCYSIQEVIDMGNKVGIIRTEGIETFGWISDDYQMIRSPGGSVWIQLHGDIADDPNDFAGE